MIAAIILIAIAITGILFACCRISGSCSRDEELRDPKREASENT